MASRYVFSACIFSGCRRVQPPTGFCVDASYTFVFERFRHFVRPGYDDSRKASLTIHKFSGNQCVYAADGQKIRLYIPSRHLSVASRCLPQDDVWPEHRRWDLFGRLVS